MCWGLSLLEVQAWLTGAWTLFFISFTSFVTFQDTDGVGLSCWWFDFLLSYMRAFVSVGWTGFLLHFYLPGDGWTIWFSPEGHTTLFIAGRLLVHYLWWYDWCWVLLVSGAHVCSCISVLSFEANANSALGCCGHANAGPQYRLCFVSIEEALSPKVRKNPVMFGEQMVARDDVFFLWNEELFRTPESWKSQGSFTWTFPNINSELQPSWGHNARFSDIMLGSQKVLVSGSVFIAQNPRHTFQSCWWSQGIHVITTLGSVGIKYMLRSAG